MSSIQRYGITRRWSDVVTYAGLAYFVEVPDDPTLDAAKQFEQVFRQVEERLAKLGSGLERLLQVIVYLPHPADLATFNAMWDQWIPEGHAPSRACLHTQLAAPGYRVELVITAATNTTS